MRSYQNSQRGVSRKFTKVLTAALTANEKTAPPFQLRRAIKYPQGSMTESKEKIPREKDVITFMHHQENK